MKPKTKLQKLVYHKLRHKLKSISQTQVDYMIRNGFTHKAFQLKLSTHCSHCSAQIPHIEKSELADSVKSICPGCGMTLQLKDDRKRTYNDRKHFCIVTKCQGWQVIRYYQFWQDCKKGLVARYNYWEVSQQWISPKGKHISISRLNGGMGIYRNNSWYGELEVRNKTYHAYDTICYPKEFIIPEIRRNGYSGETLGYTHDYFFKIILSEPKFETLLKTKQDKLFNYFANVFHLRSIDDYWIYIKIAIRNNFYVNDAFIWIDLIYTLKELKINSYDVKYICNPNYKEIHDDFIEKREQLRAKRRIDNSVISEKAKMILNSKIKYFDLLFKSDNITIRPLKSIKDFKKEAYALTHCVYSNNYIGNKNTLILTAKINGKRTETIELSLKDFNIRQCRGFKNQVSPYHDKIVSLIELSMPMIIKRSKQKKRI